MLQLIWNHRDNLQHQHPAYNSYVNGKNHLQRQLKNFNTKKWIKKIKKYFDVKLQMENLWFCVECGQFGWQAAKWSMEISLAASLWVKPMQKSGHQKWQVNQREKNTRNLQCYQTLKKEKWKVMHMSDLSSKKYLISLCLLIHIYLFQIIG